MYVCLACPLSFDFSHARMKIVFLLFSIPAPRTSNNKSERLLAATGNCAMDYDAVKS